jgi:ubiquinone biosynthesis protein Coq4
MNFYVLIKKTRAAILVFLTHQMALPFLKLIRRPEYFPYTREELQNFAPDSLGFELVNFLHRKDLQLLPFYARHDMKHILLQYDTTGEGEVCLQCFMLGNGHISFPVAATVLYGLITMPEYWQSFAKAFRRGKKSIRISNWQWFNIVKEPTAILMQKINSPKCYG